MGPEPRACVMADASSVRAALSLLGIRPRDARAYEHLGSQGSKDAAGLAQGIGVTRGQAYRSLALLRRLGHVAPEATEPVMYRAIDLSDHAEAARIAEEARTSALEAARAIFLASIVAAQAPPRGARSPERVRRLAGRRAFHRAARRLISTARSSVLISYARCASDVEEIARSDLLEMAARKRTEGVHVSIITSAPSAPGIRDPPSFLIIDGIECIFLSAKPGSLGIASQGGWTNVASLVDVAKMLHDEIRLMNGR